MAKQTRDAAEMPPLDPSKEVVEFTPEHESLVDEPGNGQEFILIQDDYTQSVYEAVSTLGRLIGPMTQHMADEAYKAIEVLYKFCDERMGKEMAAPAMAAPAMAYRIQDDHLVYASDAGFSFGYPTPSAIADVLLALDEVPEHSDVAEAADTLRSWLGGYEVEQWLLSDQAFYVNGDRLRQLVSDRIIERASTGEDVRALAAVAKTLDGNHGVLVLEGTPLWDLMTPTEERKAMPMHDAEAADEMMQWKAPALKDFADKGWDELSDQEREAIAKHYAWSANMPPEAFGDMKLPHHDAETGEAVWNGVRAAMGAMMGARGGVDMPDADRKGVYDHLAAHYKLFDKEPPELEGRSDVEDSEGDTMRDFSEGSGSNGTVTAPLNTNPTDPATAASRAASHIRSLIEQQDPTLAKGVEPEPQAGGGVARTAIEDVVAAVVNASKPQGVPEAQDETSVLESMRAALATPGLTEEQKLGIVRHYLGEEEPKPEANLAQVAQIIETMLGPVLEKVTQIERQLAETDVPLRRSLRPTPKQDQGGERRPYAPHSIRELAERNLPY